MKKVFLFSVMSFLCIACNKEKVVDLTSIKIKNSSSERLIYVGHIGTDFESALDSLRNLKPIGEEIVKEPLEVIFDYDNRLFYGIVYGECANYTDVLDTKGHYYTRTWYVGE